MSLFPTVDRFLRRRKSLSDGTFQNLNFSYVISSKSFPDMLTYEINSNLDKINLHNTGHLVKIFVKRSIEWSK